MVSCSAGYVLAEGSGDGGVGITGLGQTLLSLPPAPGLLITILTRG